MKKLSDFEQGVIWCEEYPELRDYFTYAGNIQELDVLKQRILAKEDTEKEYDKDVIEFFYKERKKNLMRAVKINKSDDWEDRDKVDMQGRADGDLYSKLLTIHRPNF